MVPPLTVDGVAVSSSEIRTALQKADVVTAARFLGRPYSMSGTITSGAGRGRTLGFPTANLAPDRELLIPKGVYGCIAHVDDVAHPAVVNIGVRPTFSETTLAVEISVFVENRPTIVSGAVGWMHFGANIGAATSPSDTPAGDVAAARAGLSGR